jgi:hypothetical protein
MTDRNELKRQFKERKVPMGVFLIRNVAANRWLVRSARNLPAAMNKLAVEVTPSTNPNVALQQDWRALGPAGFEVRILDLLEPRDEPGWDPGEDLEALAAMWRERLAAEGGVPY